MAASEIEDQQQQTATQLGKSIALHPNPDDNLSSKHATTPIIAPSQHSTLLDRFQLSARLDDDAFRQTACFAVSCGAEVGLGHLVRCQSIADALKCSVGSIDCFWSLDSSASSGEAAESIFESVVGRQFDFAACAEDVGAETGVEEDSRRGLDLQLSWAQSPESSAAEEEHLDKVVAWCQGVGATVDYFVVDSYAVTEGYLQQLRTRLQTEVNDSIVLLLLDDHLVRTVEGVLRLAPADEEARGPAETNLQGAQYFLLRKEFWSVSPQNLENRDPLLVICFGGADTEGLTRKVLEEVCRTNVSSIKEVVVLASDSLAAKQDLDALLVAGSTTTSFRRVAWADAAQVASLFSRASAAVVSCSGVAVEAAACRCPHVLAVNWTENQKMHAVFLCRNGVGVTEWASPADDAVLLRRVSVALCAAEGGEGNEMQAATPLLDPYGALRVAGALAAARDLRKQGKAVTQRP
eukprot:g17997.t1